MFQEVVVKSSSSPAAGMAFALDAVLGGGAGAGLRRAALKETSILHNPCQQEMDKLQSNGSCTEWDKFCVHVRKYGLGMLNDRAIERLRVLTSPLDGRISGVFSGLGYAEEQLAQNGFDVIACDIKVEKRRWFPEMQRANYPWACDYPERALFMSFPDRFKKRIAEGAVRLYEKNGGTLLITIRPGIPGTDEPASQHPFSGEDTLNDFLNGYRRVEAIRLPAWTNLPEMHVWTRSGHSSLHPLLEVFDVAAGRKAE